MAPDDAWPETLARVKPHLRNEPVDARMILLFKDRGWDVTTSSWTASAKPDNATTELVYLWNGDSPQRITLKISYKDLMARVVAVAMANSPIVDLRNLG